MINSNNFEKETKTGPYNGYDSMRNLGSSLNNTYGHLWQPQSKNSGFDSSDKDNNEQLPFFVGGFERLVVSAQNAARGFFGDGWQEKSRFVVLNETLDQGLNSLTPEFGCPNYNSLYNSHYELNYYGVGLTSALSRFHNDLPGSNITAVQLAALMALCPYDLNVEGSSPWCSYFNEEDWKAFRYGRDLNYYYSGGPGNPLSYGLGSVVTNASLTLLKQSSTSKDQQIYLNFVHDTDLLEYLTAFGFDLPTGILPWDRQISDISVSQLVPMAARIYLEKLVCKVDSQSNTVTQNEFIRFVINDSVHPFPNCTSGPGNSCPLDQFIEVQESRYVDAIGICGFNKPYTVPTELSFYWDWKSNPALYYNHISPNSDL